MAEGFPPTFSSRECMAEEEGRVPRGRARGAQIGVPSPPGPRAEERFQPVRITPLQRSQDVPAGIAVAVEDDPLKPDLPLLS